MIGDPKGGVVVVKSGGKLALLLPGPDERLPASGYATALHGCPSGGLPGVSQGLRPTHLSPSSWESNYRTKILFEGPTLLFSY